MLCLCQHAKGKKNNVVITQFPLADQTEFILLKYKLLLFGRHAFGMNFTINRQKSNDQSSFTPPSHKMTIFNITKT